MARVDPAWGTEHLAAIARLENTLGRAACGYPTQNGPCALEPSVDGRCAAHAAGPAVTSPRARSRARRILLMTVIAVVAAFALVGVIAHNTHDPAADLWNRALRLTAEGRRAEAEPLLALLVREHPSSPYAAKAREFLAASGRRAASPAESLFDEARNFTLSGTSADYEEAAKRFVDLVDKYHDDPIAHEALYEAALCMDHLGRTAETIKLWKRFVQDYPDDGRAAEALYALGYIHTVSLAKPEEGRAYYEELIRKYPDSSSAEAARMALGLPSTEDTAGVAVPTEKPQPSGPPSVMTTPGQL